MLFPENPGGKTLNGIVLSNWNLGLENYWSSVDCLLGEVDCAPSYPDPVFQGLFLRLKPRKGGKKSRVYVHDAVPVFVDELVADDSHVSSQ